MSGLPFSPLAQALAAGGGELGVRRACIPLVLLALTQAHGSPVDPAEVVAGEPVLVPTWTAAGQQRGWVSQPWTAFQATYGDQWRARFDEGAGALAALWGPGLEMPVVDGSELVRSVVAFVDANDALFGASADDLRPAGARYDAPTDTWSIRLDRLHDGAPVWRGGVLALVRHGRLVYASAATYPEVPVVNRPRLSLEAAVAAARGYAPGATGEGAEEVVVPVGAAGRALRRVWVVRAREPAQVVMVDAETGEIAHAWDAADIATGYVEVEHDRVSPLSERAVSPLPFAAVSTGGYTGADGWFDVPGAAATVSLDGQYASVADEAGDRAELQIDGDGDVLWSSEEDIDQLDAYVFVHQARAWGERVRPDHPMTTQQVAVTVDSGVECFASYSPDRGIRLGPEGEVCHGAARVAGILFHEWGHGFHFLSRGGVEADGVYKEAVADTIGFLVSGDFRFAPGWRKDGSVSRRFDDVRVWPDDFDAAGDLYENALIFSGAVWDLWTALQDDLGVDAGTVATERIFTGLIREATSMTAAFDLALVADDDNADLADGTPNECAIHEAFARHGLVPGTGFVAMQSPEIVAGEAIRFEGEVVSTRCDAVARGSVHWRADGGSWTETDLDFDGEVAVASLPAQDAGTFLEYWIEIESAWGDVQAQPLLGAITPYTVHVGDVLALRCEDFEADDGGFTHEVLAGDEANDNWAWGTPAGGYGDPVGAASGELLWGIGLGTFSGSAYWRDTHTRLSSPQWDTGWYEGVFLGYQRWLNVEDGRFDHARIVADEQSVWSNWDSGSDAAAEHHRDFAWLSHVVPLEGLGDDGSVQIAFELEADAGFELGGWNVDDVCLLAPATADNRLGIGDLVVVASSDGKGASLSWTHPVHAPVTEVALVRRDDRFPAAHDDGEVVFTDNQPGVGAAASFTDDRPGSATVFYAVYATDGTEWLSWTREGLNAGRTDVEVGCGCATAPSNGAPVVALVGLVALGLRRRRVRSRR